MLKKLALITLLMPISAMAMKQESMFVKEFVGGLHIKDIAQCEKIYNEKCRVKGGSAMSRVMRQRTCSTRLMAKDKDCRQASRIRQLSYNPPTDIKRYGTVSVFDVTSVADGIDTYYMVDQKGHFIALNTYMDLSQDKTFKEIKAKHPEATLTNFLYWTHPHENLFPKVFKLPNQNKRLVFKQELRDGFFVAGSKLGVAHIAYDFDKSGNYIGAKLLKIDKITT